MPTEVTTVPAPQPAASAYQKFAITHQPTIASTQAIAQIPYCQQQAPMQQRRGNAEVACESHNRVEPHAEDMTNGRPGHSKGREMAPTWNIPGVSRLRH